MKVALINTIKPRPGSGDGMTECTYRLYIALKGKMDVKTIYATTDSKRNDIAGLLYTNTLFKKRLKGLARGGYQIIHITNHELGFAAKILQGDRGGAKIVTTIHDMTRFVPGMHEGRIQSMYNTLVKGSIESAVKYSDAIIFVSSQTEMDVRKRFRKELAGKKTAVIMQGISGGLIRAKKYKLKHDFTVGYLGSLARHKNVQFILKVAEKLKHKQIRFVIYGTGATRHQLSEYIKAHKLENVALRGFVPERNIVKTYDGLDVFMLPSLNEGFGRQILEAQARGLPVIILKQGRIPSEVSKYCIRADDESAAAGIVSRIKAKGYDRRSMKKAMSYARGFTWDRAAAKTLAFYEMEKLEPRPKGRGI
jgi:glycosyltransferase involved in cell wall biosynthesis